MQIDHELGGLEGAQADSFGSRLGTLGISRRELRNAWSRG